MPEWNDAKDIDGLSRATSARSGRATSVMSRKAARVRKATRRCSKTGCETRIGDEGTSSSHDLQTLEVRVGPGSIPNLWADVCGFLKPPDSDQFWKYANMGSLYPARNTRIRSSDLSCHHETWLHLDFVDWNWSQPRCEESAQRVQLKERPAPYQYGQGKKNISDIMSDHSLSS